MIKTRRICLFLLGLLAALARLQVTQAQSQGQPPSHPQGAPVRPQSPPSPQGTPAGSQHPAVIKKIICQEDQNDLSFPVIIMADASVAKKINASLQTSLLVQDTADGSGKRPFDKTRLASERGSTDELDYTVLINSDKLISLEFEGEYMGAYPTSFEEYFQFYTRTGEPVLLEDIMTWDGREELGKDLRRKREILIAAHLEELKKDSDAVKELDYIAPRLKESNEEADSNLFSIRATGLHFHKGQSLPHVLQALDADLDIDYPFQEISAWLNDFGKKLLLKP
jgi:hypothetical protein